MVIDGSNALSWLSHRELGISDSVARRAIALRRLSRLSLDGDTCLRSQSVAGITCLAVDSAEQRYTLASAQDGSVQCFDILGTSKGVPELPLFTVLPRSHGVRDNGGHTASATAVDWFPKDNGAFVSCSKDMTAKLWDPNTAALVASFSTIQAAHTLAMSPKQPLAAVGCEDSCIRLLDVTAGVATHTLMGYSAGVLSVAWCGVNEHQVVGGDGHGEMRLFDIRRAGTLHSFDHSEASVDLEVAETSSKTAGPDNRSTTAPGGHDILATVPVATRAHDGAITGLLQTPDARWWVSAGTDNAVRLWSVADRTNTLLRFPGALNSARSMRQIAVDPASQVLYFPSGSVVSTYSLATGEKLNDLRGHLATVNAAAWSARSTGLLTGSTDKQLLLWSPGEAATDSTSVCVGGDRMPGDVDVDAWSDDDIGPAACRNSAWDGGAAGELREAFANPFSGGRRLAAAPQASRSPPPATAERVPDGNAAHGTGDHDEEATATIDRPPQRLQAVSEAALANRRSRAGGGLRGGNARIGPGGNSAGVQKARKADSASHRIKRIAAKLVQRLSSHMPVENRELTAASQGMHSTVGGAPVTDLSRSQQQQVPEPGDKKGK